MLAGAWASLVVAVGSFAIGFLRGGVILLYVAILAGAASMVLAVGFLLRGRGRSPAVPHPDERER